MTLIIDYINIVSKKSEINKENRYQIGRAHV